MPDEISMTGPGITRFLLSVFAMHPYHIHGDKQTVLCHHLGTIRSWDVASLRMVVCLLGVLDIHETNKPSYAIIL